MADVSRLPGPISDLWEWQMQGSCRSADPSLFFHPEGERGPRKEGRDRAAKAICALCPVLEQCRAHALSVREPYGVWGGLSEDERDAIYSATAAREAASRATASSAAGAASAEAAAAAVSRDGADEADTLLTGALVGSAHVAGAHAGGAQPASEATSPHGQAGRHPVAGNRRAGLRVAS